MPSPSSRALPSLHPLIEAASRGELPKWATAGSARRKHMARVAELLGKWASNRDEPPVEQARWKAVGHLHDALRDGDDEALRRSVGEAFRELPAKVLHGPAMAARLEAEGVDDPELLHAIAYHTLGSPEFQVLGMALYSADFLEPGRRLKDDWRAGLRKRFAREVEAVVQEILAARIKHLVDRGRPLRAETVAFWNQMSEGQGWASASEL